jgi:hypothetical protein
MITGKPSVHGMAEKCGDPSQLESLGWSYQNRE